MPPVFHFRETLNRSTNDLPCRGGKGEKDEERFLGRGGKEKKEKEEGGLLPSGTDWWRLVVLLLSSVFRILLCSVKILHPSCRGYE